MRNQFFGDINDYYKYGLLRTLVGAGDIKLGVCWMLTQDDGGSHGDKTNYLKDPGRWKKYDPDLFARLHEWVINQQNRKVEAIELSGLIPSAEYFTDPFPRSKCDREAYFADMLRSFNDIDLVFFDPDNGLEIASKPFTKRPSAKHLYFRELKATFEEGHSVIVIQFYPFEKHEEFIVRRGGDIRKEIGVKGMYWIRTPHVVFFLLMQHNHFEKLSSRADTFCNTWLAKIKILK